MLRFSFCLMEDDLFQRGEPVAVYVRYVAGAAVLELDFLIIFLFQMRA